MKWLDRITEPESPWTLRIMFTGAVVFYVIGCVVDPSYFAMSFGMLFFCQPMWEDRQKYKSQQRLAKYRADMKDWESKFRAAHAAARVEYTITPGWML